jgi:acetylornithine deacetylase
MNLFELTRKLIDIESITPNEDRVGVYLHGCLTELAEATGGRVESMEVEPGRRNVFAHWGDPVVTLSTHMDTVPPFFPSSDDGDNIRGRGACDTKGIIASMITAAAQLLAEGDRNFGLLFVVGEERNSAGAYYAAKNPRGSRFLVNGEPTENQLALGSKGALRFELHAEGRMAHSAYPHLGESAIEKLLDALDKARKMPLPTDKVLGPSTLNIGTIRGGRAPNVIPDEAQAELFIRLIDDGRTTRERVHALVEPAVKVKDVLTVPAVHLGKLDGLPTTVVAYTTDIPAFGGSWGQPFLIGPGTIHVAHTDHEHVPKRQLEEAVPIYKDIIRKLKRQ